MISASVRFSDVKLQHSHCEHPTYEQIWQCCPLQKLHLLCTVQICITSKIFVKMNSFGGWIWLNCRLGTSSRQAVWLDVLYLWFPVFTASLSDWMCSLRPPSLLNAVPALTLKGKNVTSAGWQVTPCDPMWHVSSRSGVATLRTAIHLLLTY